jgi:hypothetical protein
MHSPGASHLDVYGHMLDWKTNEDAAMGLGDELEKAVAEVQSKQQNKSVDSGPLTAHQKRKLPNSEFGSY